MNVIGTQFCLFEKVNTGWLQMTWITPQVPPGVKMRMGRRRARVLGLIMTLNMIICLVVVSWNLGQHKSGRRNIKIPSKRFWCRQAPSESFWNREQQRLDFIHNPIFNSALSNNSLISLPEWLNDTRPMNVCEPDQSVPTQVSDYNILPQRFQDFLLHMRCRSYPMRINQRHVCDRNPYILLAIKSMTPHFDRRQAIRQSWGRAGILANREVATVFLLGNTTSVDHFPDLSEMVTHEAGLHRDILQWDYRDTFFNLTLKEVLFLEWFTHHCPKAQYILKGDDDVFVNMMQVVQFLDGLPPVRARDLFVGDVIDNAGPHREPKVKYFIPESVFVGVYPPYAGGGGYLYSGDLALRLHNISQQVALYPIDDVYTGMCLKKLGLAPDKHKGFRTFDIEEKYRDKPCIYKNLMLVHSRTPQEMIAIWSWVVDSAQPCQ